jgi:hypothetical protein
MEKKKKARVIAFYLPQFHPIPENDVWWGKGFTEWTNVGKAKPLFPGHHQPKVPTELGYYDLRLSEVRDEQAKLADYAGIDAFCYWHYWFGNGKMLLEKPLQMVVQSGKPEFPFCLGWANHNWVRNNWNKDVSRFNKEFLIKQVYPGEEDIDNHFYRMLDTFRDMRYYKINGKLLFCIHSVDQIPNFKYFVERWNDLAKKNNLPGFYFVAIATSPAIISSGNYNVCDAVNLDLRLARVKSAFWRRISYFLPLVNLRLYSKEIRKWQDPTNRMPKVYPTIIPNWDNSPRVGRSALILHGSTPELFRKHVRATLQSIQHKDDEDKIVFLRSWNEWAEGNYMEPDLKFSREYINVLKDELMK